MTLAVGQQLWYVPREGYGGYPHAVTIAKIGSKYVTMTDGMCVDTEHLSVIHSRYSSTGRCYLSQAAYEAEQASRNAWDTLRRLMDRTYNPPDGVTAEHIQEAMVLLGLIQQETTGRAPILT